VFILPSRLTLVEAPALTVQLREVLDRDQVQTVVVKAGALEQFDSSALAFLLECRREGLRRNRLLVLEAVPAKLVALASLYGVGELLGLKSLPP
jgi:phospholipid transport system transporter-binding protein